MSHAGYIPERVMVIAAHPDDAEFSCAGTIAHWVKEGATAAFVLATSGDVGIAQPGMTNSRAAEIREAESLAAAQVLGVEDVTFLREPDGRLENTMALRRRLVREMRRFKPEAVITGDPTMIFTPSGGINHPDHRPWPARRSMPYSPRLVNPTCFKNLKQKVYEPTKSARSTSALAARGTCW